MLYVILRWYVRPPHRRRGPERGARHAVLGGLALLPGHGIRVRHAPGVGGRGEMDVSPARGVPYRLWRVTPMLGIIVQRNILMVFRSSLVVLYH